MPSAGLNFIAIYVDAILKNIPKRADTHIQKRAPGPPRWIAVPTPAILPIPTVVAMTVRKAFLCEIIRWLGSGVAFLSVSKKSGGLFLPARAAARRLIYKSMAFLYEAVRLPDVNFSFRIIFKNTEKLFRQAIAPVRYTKATPIDK